LNTGLALGTAVSREKRRNWHSQFSRTLYS